MPNPRRQAEPGIHRLLPDRVARRWESRRLERTYRDPADRRVAVTFPIERAAAIRAKVKPDAIARIGLALVNFALAVEPHPLFQIGCAEMKRGASATLARLTVAEINSFRLARGDDAKRATMAFAEPFGVNRGQNVRLPAAR